MCRYFCHHAGKTLLLILILLLSGQIEGRSVWEPSELSSGVSEPSAPSPDVSVPSLPVSESSSEPSESSAEVSESATVAEPKFSSLNLKSSQRFGPPPAGFPSLRTESRANSGPRVERAVTFWVLDGDGNWKIPLPNWTIDDVLGSIDKQSEENKELPYTIQSINVDGKVEGDIAKLKIEFRINTTDVAIVRVPLGLKEGVCILEGGKKDIYDSIRYSGQGNYSIEYDPEMNGYIAVIQNNFARNRFQKGTQAGYHLHTLTVNLCFSVQSLSNDESSLIASFPPTVHAKFRMVVPQSDIQVRVSQGVIAMPPVMLDEKSSEIVLGGLNRSGDPTEIVWFKKGEQVTRDRVILQVEEAEIDAIPSVQEVQFTVRLPIQIYGEGTDSIRIRLPQGTRLIRDSLVATGLNNNVLEIRDIKEKQEELLPSAEDFTRIIEIRLTQTVRDSLILQFKSIAEHDQRRDSPPKGQSQSPKWELGGFEVLGAQKQSGRIRLLFPEEMNFKVIPLFGVRAQQEETSGVDDLVEQYRFFTQPFSLQIQVLVRQTKIKVKSEYQISVQQGQLEMKAQFKYTVHGSKVRQLSLQFGDWFINEVKSNYLVDTDKIYTDAVTGEVILPLTVGMEGMIDIELVAVRDLVLKEGILEFPIPIPMADWMEPAAVVIVPDDNIELRPLSERNRKLRPRTQRSFSLGMDVPVRQQPPLFFQLESRDSRPLDSKAKEFSLPLFSATLQFHTRKVQVRSITDVRLPDQEGNQVLQTLTYHVTYEPLEVVSLLVPQELQDPSAIKISVQGRSIAPQRIISETLDDLDAKVVRKKILLSDQPILGNATITLRYPGPHTEFIPQMSNNVEIDIVQPDDGTLIQNELNVTTPSGISIEHRPEDNSSWKVDETGPTTWGDSITAHFSSISREQGIVLRAVLDAQDVLGTTIVERNWIQTWLFGETRLDRIVWRIVSDQKTVLIELPKEVQQNRVSVFLNNAHYFGSLAIAGASDGTVRSLFDRMGRLVIDIPPELKLKPFTLEVSYAIKQDAGVSLVEVAFPHFVGSSVWVRRSYWQLILPASRHLVGEVGAWTPEYYNNVVWSGLFWKRTASMDQDELSNWVGVPLREGIPAETNCYLFSSFNPPSYSFLHITDRALLILVGSGFTLLTGLCLIYFPVFRHRGPILLMVVAFIGICAWRPGATFIFLQTTILGIILTILALLLAKLFATSASVRSLDHQNLFAGVNVQVAPKGTHIRSSSLWVEENGGTIP